MLSNIKRDVISILLSVKIQAEEDVQAVEEQRKANSEVNVNYLHEQESVLEDEQQLQAMGGGTARSVPVTRDTPKVGRNQPCPCGSGKKYKNCHGQIS